MISVIMPVYNAEKFLRRSIESILQQTEGGFELIIVNDGSTDESEAIISSFDDSRIRLISKENGGEASARNTGLSNARGEFIVWQDADDVSLPMRLEILLKTIINFRADYVHSDMLLINQDDHPIGYWQSQQITQSRIIPFVFKIGTPFNNPSMMIRREILESKVYDTTLRIGTDTDMVSRFAPSSKGIHVSEPLLFYRIHGNNATSQVTVESANAYILKIWDQFELSDLCPDLPWDLEELDTSNRARAHAVLACSFARRGLHEKAKNLLEQGYILSTENDDRLFIDGIVNILNGQFAIAIDKLLTIKNRDHMVENFIGEAYGFSKRYNEAFTHILSAIKIKPDYGDALDNLRSIGMVMGLNIIDKSWGRFPR